MTSFIRRPQTTLAWLCVLAVGFCSTGEAQTNTENFAQFRFNFNNPGARATGIGGAFISIADDATAGESNPAGLTTVIRPELSIEVKGIQFNQRVDNYTHTGTFKNFTSISKDFKSTVVSPSFVSGVLPLKRFTFSAFRYELVNFKSAFVTKGSFVPRDTSGAYYFPVKAETRLKVANWGNAVAYKFSEAFSLGVSAGLSVISMESSLKRYSLEVFDEGSVVNTASIDEQSTNFFINAGLIAKPTENLSIGAVFKRRPAFDLHHTFTSKRFPSDTSTVKTIHFKVPSSMGIGVSYRPIDVLTISFDAVRVLYSQLTDDFVLTIGEEYAKANDFTVDDGMEFHGGAEYVFFFQSIGFVLRGGVYFEPDNRIRWVGNINDSNDPDRIFTRKLLAGLFQEGKTYFHTTFGLGVVLSNSFQVDFAGNLSSISNEIVGSLEVRF